MAKSPHPALTRLAATVTARYFPGKPARSCVAVKAIPKGCLVEIEAIVAL